MLGRSAMHPRSDSSRSTREEVVLMPVDPVCGMAVQEETAVAKSRFEGVTYFFCSEGCKQRFDQSPARFIARADGDGDT